MAYRSPDLADVNKSNQQSINQVSKELEAGHAANIYPCGTTRVDATQGQWRNGLGRIIGQLPQSALEEVLLVPYETSPFSKFRFLGAIAARGHWPMEIDLNFGHIQTAAEAVKQSGSGAAEEITETLRIEYANHFKRQD